jgi:hypothetical protein
MLSAMAGIADRAGGQGLDGRHLQCGLTIVDRPGQRLDCFGVRALEGLKSLGGGDPDVQIVVPHQSGNCGYGPDRINVRKSTECPHGRPADK